MNKPPIGVMPEHIWLERHPYYKPSDIAARIESIEAACYRYIEYKGSFPVEWFLELDSRRKQLEPWK